MILIEKGVLKRKKEGKKSFPSPGHEER